MSEERIFRGTLEEIQRLPDETNWERLRADEAAGIEPEPDEEDEPPEDIDWSKATWVVPERKEAVSIRLDPDVLAFFRGDGRGYQTRINAVLRAYMEARAEDADRKAG